MKKRVLSGLLGAVLALAVAVPVFAVSVMTIEVEPDVKVYVNDASIDAGDTHGNPEAFIYNGTTYIAAKAVSLSLGENVKWDGSTRSVYIGKHEGASAYLLNVCPPYQESCLRTPATVSMAGKQYANCFYLGDYSWQGDGCWALFNLNGKYDTLKFVAGHMDGHDMYSGSINIYLDGELALSVELDGEMLPEEYVLPLNGALQMKIENGGQASSYALADIRVS